MLNLNQILIVHLVLQVLD
ncbi:unnamed protein product [Spirodela intermedia]|uniref:Uncharacterized protein n=1 Tax=Spirodela intermedia TaxID=51605 RepID=A0A7I8KEH1_SPIIN|nr:unnamed protein product [Spirodela intermedia]